MESRDNSNINRENEPDLETLDQLIKKHRKTEKDLLFEEIADLREPMKRILGEMKDNINSGAYDLVIGEDVSGRIPALVLGRIIAEVNKRKGRPAPKRIFLAGSGSAAVSPLTDEELGLKTEQLGDFLSKQEAKRALVVTDTIVTGKTLKPILDALDANGIKNDTATLVLRPALISEKRKEEESKSDDDSNFVYVGQVEARANPSVYRTGGLAGVFKNPKNLFSEPVKNSWNSPEAMQRILNEARKDIQILSDELMADLE